MTTTSPWTAPSTSPGWQRPAMVIVDFSATVTSPCRAWPAALLIATTADSKSADGS